MFIFNNTEDLNIASYNYELYDEDQIAQTSPGVYQPISNATILSSGSNNASVFTVNVNGSYIDENGEEQKKHYYGRVRTLNTSGVYGNWTAIVRTDTETDLLDEQYIVSLTADRIKAGIIESAEIILGGANPQETLIKSSTYNGTYNPSTGKWETGTAGWLIAGNGQAIFDATQIRGSISAGSINLNTHNYWLPPNPPSTTVTTFKVGTASQYLLFDGINLTLSGALSAASGTFSGTLQVGNVEIGNDVGPGTGHYGISLSPTDFNNIFLRRSDGVYFFRVGVGGANSISWDSSSGVLSVVGSVTATSGSIAGINMNGGRLYSGPNGNWANTNTGFYLDQNGYFSLKNQFYFNPDANSGAGQATFTGALSGASGSVGANFNIGDNLFVGNFVRINGPDPSNVTVTKIRGFKNLGDTDANARWTLVLEGPNGTNKWEVRDDGLMQYRTQSAYSDIRIKTNIETSNLGLNFIKSLKPRSYNLSLGENEEGVEVFKQVKTYGFVAQEVKQAYEQYTDSFDGWGLSVAGDDDSLQTVSYDNFISPLVKAVQELSAKVDELESRLV